MPLVVSTNYREPVKCTNFGGIAFTGLNPFPAYKKLQNRAGPVLV